MFNDISDEYPIMDVVRSSLVMRPCKSFYQHSENCYSVFKAGTDFCLFSHLDYASAFRHVYGRFPTEDEDDE